MIDTIAEIIARTRVLSELESDLSKVVIIATTNDHEAMMKNIKKTKDINALTSVSIYFFMALPSQSPSAEVASGLFSFAFLG